ncbi:hypothetical protein ACS3UN_00375 [Oscillospiraceae bacterium LTW-04]|nr:hypothetical protein RBH76_10060 [Oscillospiraceae bacterium MB24-C1]
MIKKGIALILAMVLLASCQSAPSSSSAAPSSSQSSSSSETADHIENGRFVFKQLDDPVFTMDYEPRSGSVTMQHFGLNFPNGTDTDWLGDSGFDTLFNIHEAETDQVYGSVVITTAPADLAAYYNTSDPQEQLNQMKPTFFTTDVYYEGLKKNIVEDFGYDLIVDEKGIAFDGGWNAFYFEFIDKESGNHALRFYMCNDQMNEKFYAMTIKVDVPVNDTENLKIYRDIIFTLHPMEG